MGFYFVSSGKEFLDVILKNICDIVINNDINLIVFVFYFIIVSCVVVFYLVMFFLGIFGVCF